MPPVINISEDGERKAPRESVQKMTRLALSYDELTVPAVRFFLVLLIVLVHGFASPGSITKGSVQNQEISVSHLLLLKDYLVWLDPSSKTIYRVRVSTRSGSRSENQIDFAAAEALWLGKHLQDPIDVTVDQSGHIYFVDADAAAIFLLVPNAEPKLIYSGAPLERPISLAAAGPWLYVSDAGARKIFAFNPAKKEILEEYKFPESARVSDRLRYSAGDLVAHDSGSSIIYRFALDEEKLKPVPEVPGDWKSVAAYSTISRSELIDFGKAVREPADVSIANNVVYVLDKQQSRIVLIPLDSGDPSFLPYAQLFDDPSALVAGEEELFVAEGKRHRFQRQPVLLPATLFFEGMQSGSQIVEFYGYLYERKLLPIRDYKVPTATTLREFVMTQGIVPMTYAPEFDRLFCRLNGRLCPSQANSIKDIAKPVQSEITLEPGQSVALPDLIVTTYTAKRNLALPLNPDIYKGLFKELADKQLGTFAEVLAPNRMKQSGLRSILEKFNPGYSGPNILAETEGSFIIPVEAGKIRATVSKADLLDQNSPLNRIVSRKNVTGLSAVIQSVPKSLTLPGRPGLPPPVMPMPINGFDCQPLGYNSGSVVTDATTFSSYGITDFQVQYWNGATFVDVPGGNVTGNNLVKRKFLFPDITTNRLRLLVNNTADGTFSRVVEIEAFHCSPGSTPTANSCAPGNNVASAANGATASASSEFSAQYPASGVIDGEHDGNNWAAGGGWSDATPNARSDTLEVSFSSSQTINEIDVYTLKDDSNVKSRALAIIGHCAPSSVRAVTSVGIIDNRFNDKHPAFRVMNSNESSLTTFKAPGSTVDHLPLNDPDRPNPTTFLRDLDHGTHVAAIIGAHAQNGKMIGVYPAARLYGLTTEDFDQFIEFHDSVRLFNVSLGEQSASAGTEGQPFTGTERLKQIVSQHSLALFVVAAGNDGQKVKKDTLASLGFLDNVLVVAASNIPPDLQSPLGLLLKQDGKGSNFGSKFVGMAAPGENILSALYNGEYGLAEGTSQATAFVTGAAAALMAVEPGWEAWQVKFRLVATADLWTDTHQSEDVFSGELAMRRAIFDTAEVVTQHEFRGVCKGLIDPSFLNNRLELKKPTLSIPLARILRVRRHRNDATRYTIIYYEERPLDSDPEKMNRYLMRRDVNASDMKENFSFDFVPTTPSATCSNGSVSFKELVDFVNIFSLPNN
jgi:hypothetical protein